MQFKSFALALLCAAPAFAQLDCGGGRAPPKTTVPGCPGYVGAAAKTSTISAPAAPTDTYVTPIEKGDNYQPPPAVISDTDSNYASSPSSMAYGMAYSSSSEKESEYVSSVVSDVVPTYAAESTFVSEVVKPSASAYDASEPAKSTFVSSVVSDVQPTYTAESTFVSEVVKPSVPAYEAPKPSANATRPSNSTGSATPSTVPEGAAGMVLPGVVSVLAVVAVGMMALA